MKIFYFSMQFSPHIKEYCKQDVKKDIISKTAYDNKISKMRIFRDNFVHKLKDNLNINRL